MTFQGKIFVVLILISVFIGIIGFYTLRTSPYLSFGPVSPIDITKRRILRIEQIPLDSNLFLRLPEFFTPRQEKDWWHRHEMLYRLLTERDSVRVKFSDNTGTAREVEARVTLMPFSLIIKRTGLIYFVALIFLLSAGSVFQRHRCLSGTLCAFFLVSMAIYFISAAPVVGRSLTLNPLLFQMLIKSVYIAAGGMITLVHFAFVFPRPKEILTRFPRLSHIFYGYFMVTIILYLSGLIAFGATFPFLCFWIALMAGALLHSLLKEKDTFLRKQIRLSLMAPLLVGTIFIVLNLLPEVLGISSMRFTSFALFSLILPFALPSAIDNLRLYQERLEMEQKTQREKERTREELHDTILNNLANISVSSEVALKFLENKAAGVKDRLRLIKELARDSSRQLRGFLWIIDERHNTWEDFSGYLRKCGHDLLGHLEADFELEASQALMKLSPPCLSIRVCLYQVFREAITNIISHSQADTVRAALSGNKEGVILKIKDNGIGFKLESPKEGHYGLKNMKKRVEEFHGLFNVNSRPGQGTRIEVRVPLG